MAERELTDAEKAAAAARLLKVYEKSGKDPDVGVVVGEVAHKILEKPTEKPKEVNK